jgi:hypothetical protein
LLLFNYKAQQSAAAPNKIWFLSLRPKPFSQEPSILEKLVVDRTPKVNSTEFPNKACKVAVKKKTTRVGWPTKS